jgi:hypothetical protein
MEVKMPDYTVLDRDEQIRLLKSLQRLSVSGALTWEDPYAGEEDPDYTDVFVSEIEDETNSFKFLLDSVDSDGVSPYRLQVTQKNVRTGRYINIAIIAMELERAGGDSEINALVDDLYSTATRSARRPEEVIRQLFSQLSELEEEPPF